MKQSSRKPAKQTMVQELADEGGLRSGARQSSLFEPDGSHGLETL